MKRALDLASLGGREVMPNPQVGCVIVYNHQIIGEGYHREFGGPHAEVHAILSVKNPEWLKLSTLYVTLEPCSHFGKTPPCANLIINSGIRKVVIGSQDPNPLVSGNGIKLLKEAGIDVVSGVMDTENRTLNTRFFTFHEKKRPYVILKWAQSADGFLDKNRSDPNEPPEWITDEYCRTLVHQWRSREQSIVVGSKTILMDNPKLDVRNWTGKNPIRIIIAGKTIFSNKTNILNGLTKTYIFTSNSNYPKTQNVEIIFMPNYSAKAILTRIYELKIQSVFIEGGKKTLDIFLTENLWDEARVFTGKSCFFEGLKSPELDKHLLSISTIHQEITLDYFSNKK
jgi:diaminohydroxyphosphoribosylaminopyrimidine deaminase/5-amino-6-(5-phosphoribosylamino)uracil reductase